MSDEDEETELSDESDDELEQNEETNNIMMKTIIHEIETEYM